MRKSPRHLAAASLLAASTCVATADITGAYIVRYQVTAEDFGGGSITTWVEDLYLSSNDAADVALNTYNVMLVEEAKVSYFQSATSTGWLAQNAGGVFDNAALRKADSFVTMGGFDQDVFRPEQVPGAGAGSGLDPNFGGNNAAYPGENAGWYNGSPPSLNGAVGNVEGPDGTFGLGVLIGRFSSTEDFTLAGSTIEVTWNQGLGTPGDQGMFLIAGDPVDDCNGNGIPDPSDIAEGTSADCNDNGIPDECDLADGGALDCNENGTLDACDLADGSATDCDGNDVPDACDLADGTAVDCNANGIPDSCDLASNPSSDCNDNGIPDECEPSGLDSDYNQNGVNDICEALSVPGDFETIADAIANAPEGSVIFVEAGNYATPVVLDRSIAIVAPDGPGTTKLDGSKSLGPVVFADDAPAGAILAGFTIRGGDPSAEHPFGGGIVGLDSSLTLADCVVVGNTGLDGGGIRLDGGTPTILRCEIRDNLSFDAGGGLLHRDSGITGSRIDIVDCTFNGNVSLAGRGHAAAVFADGSIDGCEVFDHPGSGSTLRHRWTVAAGLNDFLLIDSIVRDNAGDGVDGINLIERTAITGNGGYGVANADQQVTYEIRDSRICGNTAGALAPAARDALAIDEDNIVFDDRCPDLVVPDDADEIHVAIEAALDGDRIAVRPGDWSPFSLIDRDLELISTEGAEVTTIGSWGSRIEGGGDANLVRGFTFTHGQPGLVPSYSLTIGNASPWIDQCEFRDNGVGGLLVNGTVLISSTLIEGNGAGNSSGGGIYLGSGTLTLDQVTVTGNLLSQPYGPSTRGGGVYVGSGADLILIDSTICENAWENLADLGTVSDQGGNTICIAIDCDDNGIEDASDIQDLGRPDCDGNLVPDDCDIAGGAAEDCDENGVPDACQLADGVDDLNLNGVIDACEDELVFDVPTVFSSIESALAAAPDGSVVQLAAGTYTDPIDFDGHDVTLRGDLSDPTAVILDGSGGDASVIAFTTGQTELAGLEGVTVTGGMMGTPLPGQPTSLAGGGVYMFESSPRFQSVIFRDNVAGFGGGVYALRGAPTFDDCVFSGNFASTDGGGLMLFDTDARIVGCRLEQNTAVNDGGGIKVVRGTAEISTTALETNDATEGGGLYFFSEPDTAPLPLDGVTISGNTAAKSGGGIKARFGLPGFTISDSGICDNEPDNIVGDYEDVGGNDLCVCPWDLNGDGRVDGVDLGLFLAYQSTCTPDEYCPADFDGDGVVDSGDLGYLLGFWGLCP